MIECKAIKVCIDDFFDCIDSCTKKLTIDDSEKSEKKSEKDDETSKWEVLTKQDHMSVMRRLMETGIYEYKGMLYVIIPVYV